MIRSTFFFFFIVHDKAKNFINYTENIAQQGEFSNSVSEWQAESCNKPTHAESPKLSTFSKYLRPIHAEVRRSTPECRTSTPDCLPVASMSDERKIEVTRKLICDVLDSCNVDRRVSLLSDVLTELKERLSEDNKGDVD